MKLPSLTIALVCLSAFAQQPTGSIRFEEVAAQAGVSFTHSFGAAKLGSSSATMPAPSGSTTITTACSTYT
jgi:hypothetical protein